MKSEIKRATGLLVIEVVNSNPNGDPDRESDPRQRANGLGKSLRFPSNGNCAICWRITMRRFSAVSQNSFFAE